MTLGIVVVVCDGVTLSLDHLAYRVKRDDCNLLLSNILTHES